ncbi:MAG: hypothetical protein AAB740_02920 [Patescibacteria group bacterium]
MQTKIIFAVLAILAVVLIAGLIFLPLFLPFSKTSSSRVISAISQIRVALWEYYTIRVISAISQIRVALWEYYTINGAFDGFSLNTKDLLPLTKQINKYSYNKTPLKIITYSVASSSSFCMFVPIYKTIDGMEWYCADSIGRADIIRTNPAGVCTGGQPARCPDDESPPKGL